MTEVVFLSSLQDYQLERVQDMADRLRKDRPELRVQVFSPEDSRSRLAALKLKFGPAIVIDGRLEFVGVPRYRILVERIETSIERAKHPPPPEPPAPPAPAARPAPVPTPPKPVAPPAKPSA